VEVPAKHCHGPARSLEQKLAYPDQCMQAKVNHLYEQKKDISTGAVADGEKGNTSVDRATCLCSHRTIFCSQV